MKPHHTLLHAFLAIYPVTPLPPPGILALIRQMTGVKFDPSNFKALTLGNIFQMELHRFTADIDDIVNESVQELKIENEIRKVEATWRKTDLVLAKYQKNGVDRSYVLKAADEIKTELEDNLLNLQTMSSSRFVGSFADQVRPPHSVAVGTNSCFSQLHATCS